jgi:NAD(P)-dependent dehydrogenase (short-subunit alcohol dehydrogenase family)
VAVVGLTTSLAMDVGLAGIRVNAIMPGVGDGARLTKANRCQGRRAGLSYAGLFYEEMEKRCL